MALKGTTTEAKIWNFLSEKGLNDYGVAKEKVTDGSIMTNMQRRK